MIHLYEIFLELNDIEYRATRVATPRTNGFVERFNRTVLDEFFRMAFRKQLFESVEALQKELDKWIISTIMSGLIGDIVTRDADPWKLLNWVKSAAGNWKNRRLKH